MTDAAIFPGPWAALALAGPERAPACAVAAGEHLAELARLASRSTRLRYLPSPSYRAHGAFHEIPHFIFNGPQGGDETQRIGLFAGIHGDEPEGVLALAELLHELERDPEPARGFRLHVYPVCNPGGFSAGTRLAPSGRDLNREFWRRSAEPEVWWLEHELITRRLHGVISLHSDDLAQGVYAYARGAASSEPLARAALAAAASHLPADGSARLDGFAANQGIVRECFEGVLGVPSAALTPRPFEIIFETPQRAPASAQVSAAKSAVRAILEGCRGWPGELPGV